MRRVILALSATALGLVLLLSYKTHQVGSVHSALTGSSLHSVGSAPPKGGGSPAPSSAPRSSSTPSSKPSAPSSGVRTATGQPYQNPYGIVQVQATLNGSKITDVQLVQLTASDPRSEMINSSAAPLLRQEALAAQSANIDTVSGATYTSESYAQSLQSALDSLHG